MKIIAGSTNEPLAQGIAQTSGLSLVVREIVKFSDSEIRVRIEESVSGEDIVLVQSFAGEVNNAIIESFLLLDTLKKKGANNVVGLFPYFPYARQNKEHRPGESISAQTIAILLETLGIGKLVTYDIHALNALTFFHIPTINISILPLLLRKLIADIGEEKKSNLIVVAPDQDGAKRVKLASDELNLPHGFVQKERDLDALDKLKEIHGQKVIGDVDGKTVVLADDMIATGSTLVQAAQYVKEAGATDVYAIATHGLFTKGFDILTSDEVIKKIYISDSILQKNLPAKITTVSTVSLVATILK